MLVQLIYGSSTVHPFTEAELASLLAVARANNEAHGITGLLLYYDQNFLQVLEGEEDAVDAVFRKIADDPRHRAVSKLVRMPITERSFEGWSMAFHALAPEEADQFGGFLQIRKLRSDSFDSRTVRATVAAFQRATRLVYP